MKKERRWFLYAMGGCGLGFLGALVGLGREARDASVEAWPAGASPVPVAPGRWDDWNKHLEAYGDSNEMASNDLEWVHHSVIPLKGTSDYERVPLYRDYIDLLVEGIIAPDRQRVGSGSYLITDGGRQMILGVDDLEFHADAADDFSFMDVPYKGPGTLLIDMFWYTGEVTSSGEQISYMPYFADVAAIAAHEGAHWAQQMRLLEEVKARVDLSEEEKEKMYYQLRTEAINLGIWELEAQWVGYKAFNEVFYDLNVGVGGALVVEEELEGLPEYQRQLVSRGLSWTSHDWVREIARGRGWDGQQVERIEQGLKAYVPIFR